MDNLMTLLKPLHSKYLLTTYEQFYIHSFHKNGKLISEQSPGNPNPIFDLIIHLPKLDANRSSCALNPSMDMLPANQVWQPSAATGMYFISLQTKSHLYSTEATTHCTPHDNHATNVH